MHEFFDSPGPPALTLTGVAAMGTALIVHEWQGAIGGLLFALLIPLAMQVPRSLPGHIGIIVLAALTIYVNWYANVFYFNGGRWDLKPLAGLAALFMLMLITRGFGQWRDE